MKKNNRANILYLKTILLCLLTFFLSLLLFHAFPMQTYAASVEFPGSGTKEDPYLIENAASLVKFRDLVNEGSSFDYTYFKQTADIDLTQYGNWIPIGKFGEENYFYGYYDGAGHTISNLNMDYPSDDVSGNVALFGLLCGEVRNLGIESGNIRGCCVGSIASHGLATATIINCYNKASVSGIRAGGIADNFSGRILFCINLGEVDAPDGSAAGLISYDGNLIRYSYSMGDAPLVTPAFTGTMEYSHILFEEDLTDDFIARLNERMSEYQDTTIDLDGLCYIDWDGVNIEYQKESDFAIKANHTFTDGIIVLLIVVMLFGIILADILINGNFAYRKKANFYEC